MVSAESDLGPSEPANVTTTFFIGIIVAAVRIIFNGDTVGYIDYTHMF